MASTRLRRQAACTISAKDANSTLVSFLERRFTYHTRDDWHALIAQGRVLVNQAPANPETVLKLQDTVVYLPAETPEPPVCTGITTVFEDECLLVIDKPGNLPCHPAGAYFRHTLWALLKEQNCPFEPHFVTRLDRETSGLVLIAKDADTANGCRRQFERRTVQKVYLALVHGRLDQPINAEGWMVPDPGSLVNKKQRFIPGVSGQDQPPPASGKWSTTHLAPQKNRDGITLVQAIPLTGRYHQIRATLQALGLPIVGDKLYGLDEHFFLRFVKQELTDADRDRLRLPRQALHAAGLQIQHPRSGQPLTFEAPMPPDMNCL